MSSICRSVTAMQPAVQSRTFVGSMPGRGPPWMKMSPPGKSPALRQRRCRPHSDKRYQLKDDTYFQGCAYRLCRCPPESGRLPRIACAPQEQNPVRPDRFAILDRLRREQASAAPCKAERGSPRVRHSCGTCWRSRTETLPTRPTGRRGGEIGWFSLLDASFVRPDMDITLPCQCCVINVRGQARHLPSVGQPAHRLMPCVPTAAP